MESIKKYLEQKEVFCKKEISDVTLKTIIKLNSTIFINLCEFEKIMNGCFCLEINFIDFSGENKNISIYQYLSENDFYSFVKENFVPIKELILSLDEIVNYSREELSKLPDHDKKEDVENYLNNNKIK